MAWNKRKLVYWGLALAALTSATLFALLLLGARAMNARLAPDAVGWEDAARAFHERAAREKERDASRRSPVLSGAPLPGNAVTGYVRALQLVHEQPGSPFLWRLPVQLATLRLGPGGEDPAAAKERAFLDANRAAVAALVSATRCEACSWGVDFESELDHAPLPGPRARLFSRAAALGDACLAVARERAFAGDVEGALEHVLAAARWAIDECPGIERQRAGLTYTSTGHLVWLSSKLEPGRLSSHAARIERALAALEEHIPSAAERIANERFEHERFMVCLSEGMERECERVPVVGSFFKEYSAPIARGLASRDVGWNEQRALYLEAEKAAAIGGRLEQRGALEAVDARWPRARPTNGPSGHFALEVGGVDREQSWLALVRSILELEARFARDGQAPREWPLPQDPGADRPWIYQPRDDGQGWRVLMIVLDRVTGPRLVTFMER